MRIKNEGVKSKEGSSLQLMLIPLHQLALLITPPQPQVAFSTERWR
jgi:hypothetical protein